MNKKLGRSNEGPSKEPETQIAGPFVHNPGGNRAALHHFKSSRKTRSVAGNEIVIPTMCHGCSYGGYNCGVLAHVKDGTLTRVEGNPYHPLNKGKLCAKGQAAVQWVYNWQRLKYPLVRVGKRGANKFKRVPWDVALNTIADKLKETKERSGPEYLMFSKGQSSSWSGLHNLLWAKFLFVLGSPNFTNWGPSVCYAPQLMYHKQIIGGPTYARPDYANADLIVEWFTGGATGGAARGGVETLDTNLGLSKPIARGFSCKPSSYLLLKTGT